MWNEKRSDKANSAPAQITARSVATNRKWCGRKALRGRLKVAVARSAPRSEKGGVGQSFVPVDAISFSNASGVGGQVGTEDRSYSASSVFAASEGDEPRTVMPL